MNDPIIFPVAVISLILVLAILITYKYFNKKEKDLQKSDEELTRLIITYGGTDSNVRQFVFYTDKTFNLICDEWKEFYDWYIHSNKSYYEFYSDNYVAILQRKYIISIEFVRHDVM